MCGVFEGGGCNESEMVHYAVKSALSDARRNSENE